MTDFNNIPTDEDRRRAAAATTPPPQPSSPPPEGRPGWLKWLIPVAIILLVLFLLSRCMDRDEEVAPVDARASESAAGTAVMPSTQGGQSSPSGISGLDRYLAGTDAAPRVFAFERVNFDTGSSTIRPQDVAEIEAVAAALQRYPAAQLRVQGYADARGDAGANQALALARANAVKNALAASGGDAGRIEAVSGGETNPVGSNATAGGQAENRRTELVVVRR